MKGTQIHNTLYKEIANALQCVLLTIFVCSIAYPVLIWFGAQTMVPEKSEGSLVKDVHGRIIGSSLIAQKFTNKGYFWSRPSAVDYNAFGSGGSNLSPYSLTLYGNINKMIQSAGLSDDKPIPVDLLLASGSGLDPDITYEAALYQIKRVSLQRGIDSTRIKELIDDQVKRHSSLLGLNNLVNVLMLNIALDKESVALHSKQQLNKR